MSTPPNILFILTDQLRTDSVGFGPRGCFPTPNLDRIAAQGTVFSACQSVSPICQPARAALLTGRYPHQIGLRGMAGELSPEYPTFARALQGAGYHTAAAGKLHYLQGWPWGTSAGEGYDLAGNKEFFQSYGFDEIWQSAGKQQVKQNYCDWAAYLEDRGLLDTYRQYAIAAGPNHNHPDLTLDGDGYPLPFAGEHHVDIVTARESIRILRERPAGKPFFLLSSFCSPHKPFDPPREYLDQIPDEAIDAFLPAPDGSVPEPAVQKILARLRRAYLATVRLIDDQVGLLLAELEAQGELQNTLILFSSDHGEMMGDHGRVQKDIFWHSSLTVPTFITDFRNPLSSLCEDPVELTDLTATILDAAGLNPTEALSLPWPLGQNAVPCRSLLPLAHGNPQPIREFSFSQAWNWDCLQSRKFKYARSLDESRRSVTEWLFDLENDPDEMKNLADHPESTPLLEGFRQKRNQVYDATPAAQICLRKPVPPFGRAATGLP